MRHVLRLFASVVVLFLLLSAVPAGADWDPGDEHKMHYPQLPDPTGWDVAASSMADDWMCSETGYVTDIHIWGSWFEDVVLPIVNVHLEIWSDQPVDPPNVLYSRPDTLLWETDFQAGTFVSRPYGDPSPQGWFDPIDGVAIPANHLQTFQYNFLIPKEEAFIQEEGTIYWLVVELVLDGPPYWGWKTSQDHWNDDSVYVDPTGAWIELFDPLEPAVSLDQAFVITGEPLADWGDAPDPTYPTLAASTGANHALVGSLWLGSVVDYDPDGQPNVAALGDDNDGTDDEDGVVFTGSFVPGQQTPMTVTVSTACAISAWVDFNGDGDWLDALETLYAGMPLTAGSHVMPLGVPAGAVPGQTYARFRVTTTGALPPTGSAPDGEVEDYAIVIAEPPPDRDFGDAPDAPFPTLLASNGARHVIDGVTGMGGLPDAEADGQPSGTAAGDDSNGIDDEDGVTLISPLIPGFTAFVDVSATVPGFLDAWVDFAGNGTWADPGDQIFTSHPLVGGINNLSFTVPAGTPSGGVFARFRFSTTGGLGFTGQASDGEVEDYEVFIEEPIEDWGDAPDPFYPTLAISNGAVHTLVETVYLGSAVADDETNGQPDGTATGDDTDGYDDEDGVFHEPVTIYPGVTLRVTVTASTAGYLNGWVDFNADGDWIDAGEHVFNDVAVTAGNNVLSFTTPLAATSPTFARYRFDTIGGLTDIGPASDGEVEDHLLVEAIFIDGFESGNTSAWSVVVGLAP